MKTATIEVGTKVWGPKRSYLGTVTKLKNADFGGVVFATVTWGQNVGLPQDKVCNVERLEIRE